MQRFEILFLVFSSITAHAFNLEYKLIQAPECGIASYRLGQDGEICGYYYQKMRSPDCGVELYNSRHDVSCPGNYIYEKTSNSRPAPSCNSHDLTLERHCNYQSVSFAERGGDWSCYTKCHHRPFCAKPEFGIALYRECEHPNHPRLHAKSCRAPQFGIEDYNECQLLLTSEEIKIYARYLKNNMSELEKNHDRYELIYYAIHQLEQEMACKIKSTDRDLYLEMVPIFESTFQKIFNPDEHACQGQLSTIDIENIVCDDESLKCQTITSLKEIRQIFQNHFNTINLLLSDIVAKNNKSVENTLDELRKWYEEKLK